MNGAHDISEFAGGGGGGGGGGEGVGACLNRKKEASPALKVILFGP